jgi:hypothetical protein
MESGWPSSSVPRTADACFCGSGAARRVSATRMRPGGIPLQPETGDGSPARSSARCRFRWPDNPHGLRQLPQRLARPVLTSAVVRPYRRHQRLSVESKIKTRRERSCLVGIAHLVQPKQEIRADDEVSADGLVGVGSAQCAGTPIAAVAVGFEIAALAGATASNRSTRARGALTMLPSCVAGRSW